MRGLWLAAALLLLTAGCASMPVVSRAYESVYRVRGLNANGDTYTGVVQVLIEGDAVKVHWITGEGDGWGSGYQHKGVLYLGTLVGSSLGSAVMRPTPNGYAGEWISGRMPRPLVESWDRLPPGTAIPHPPVRQTPERERA